MIKRKFRLKKGCIRSTAGWIFCCAGCLGLGRKRSGELGTTSRLTPREREILSWVARGKSAWEIGAILHITKWTVDEHVANAMRKLGAVNRVQAIAIPVREGMIET